MDRRMIVRIVGGALGLVCGVLMMTIGFWRTLLLIALTAAGSYLSGNTALQHQIEALIGRIRHRDIDA